jgi:hypothetical protein
VRKPTALVPVSAESSLAPPRASPAASGSSAFPGFTPAVLKSAVGARDPEIAAREGPHFTCRRGSPSPTAAYGVACEAREAHRRLRRRADAATRTIFQARYIGTAAAGSATPAYRYSRVGNGQVDSGGGRGLLAGE